MGVAGLLAGVLLILVMLAIALKYTLVEPSVAGAAAMSSGSSCLPRPERKTND